jgi:hydrogenase nickel incorporation protein HypA/HybF
MHEVHLVRELISTVERQATAQGARRVKLVRLRYNPLISHEAEHVEFCFDVVKKESQLVKDAGLALSRIAPQVRCQDCKHEFETDELPNICPKCNSVNLQPVNPTELALEGFEIER